MSIKKIEWGQGPVHTTNWVKGFFYFVAKYFLTLKF